MKVKVVEMAMKRGDAISFLMSGNSQRFSNLIKIFLFRDTTTIRHWCSEIRGLWNSNFKLKHDNKYASEEFVLDFIWSAWEDTFDDICDVRVDAACKEESKSVPVYSKKNLYLFTEDFLHWFARSIVDKRGNSIEVDDMEFYARGILPQYPMNDEKEESVNENSN